MDALNPGGQAISPAGRQNLAQAYVEALVEGQALVSELSPLITGRDALDDLVILKSKQTAASIVPTAVATIFTVNSNADTNDGVCNAAPDCTLREAINAANANMGADAINFSIGSGPQTIIPLTALPTITGAVTIDGTTQPGFTSTPIIELSGSSVPNGTFALLITGGSSTVRGLVINRFDGNPGPAIRFQTNGGNIVEGNFIGTDVTGTIAFGNGKPSEDAIGVRFSVGALDCSFPSSSNGRTPPC